MSISFAGVDLLLDSHDGSVADWTDRYLSIDDLRLFGLESIARYNQIPSRNTPGNQEPALPYPNYSDPLRIKLNTLYWPTGASRWAFGLFLADSDRVASIAAALGSSNGPQPLILSTDPSVRSVIRPSEPDTPGDRFLEAGEIGTAVRANAISPDMYLLPPRPLGGNATDNNTAWIVPLVDRRYFWQFKSVAIQQSATKRLLWPDVLGAIAAALGEGNRAQSFAGYLDADPVTLLREHHNGGTLLDMLAFSVGSRIDSLPTDVTPFSNCANCFDVRPFLAGEELNDRAAQCPPGRDLAGDGLGLFIGDYAGAIPSQLRICFRKYDNGHFFDDSHVEIRNASSFTTRRATTDYVYTINLTAARDFQNVVTHGQETVPSAGVLSNIQTLATTIATDFYNGLRLPFDHSCSGVISTLPTIYDDWVEWSVGRRRSDGTYEGQTRFHGRPYNFGVNQLLMQWQDLIQYDDFIEGVLLEDMPAFSQADLDVTISGVIGGEGTEEVLVTEGYGCEAFEGDRIGCHRTTTREWRPIIYSCTAPPVPPEPPVPSPSPSVSASPAASPSPSASPSPPVSPSPTDCSTCLWIVRLGDPFDVGEIIFFWELLSDDCTDDCICVEPEETPGGPDAPRDQQKFTACEPPAAASPSPSVSASPSPSVSIAESCADFTCVVEWNGDDWDTIEDCPTLGGIPAVKCACQVPDPWTEGPTLRTVPCVTP